MKKKMNIYEVKQNTTSTMHHVIKTGDNRKRSNAIL